MPKFEHADGEYTRLIENHFWEDDYYLSLDSDCLPNKVKDLLSDFEKENYFFDGIINYVKQHFPDKKIDSATNISNFIQSQCKKNGVLDLSRQTIINWFKKSAPNGNELSRRNVYKLCFALEMDASETRDFFLTVYKERPYNYKEPFELVYAYALNNGISYTDANKLLEQISDIVNSEDISLPIEGIQTVLMEDSVFNLNNTTELISYVKEHKAAFLSKNQTGTQEVISLLDDCSKLIVEYYELATSDKRLSDTAILEYIYGQAIRPDKKSNGDCFTGLNKTALPAYVRRNIPQIVQLSEIRRGKASYDCIRKTLVLLEFYTFYLEALVQDVQFPDVDQFRYELNYLLYNCGYGEVYLRNPYDFIFLYCSAQESPLDSFHTLIEDYCTNS